MRLTALSMSSGSSAPEPQKIWRMYSAWDREFGIVRGDAPDARVDGKGDLDQLVERRLMGFSAERAEVLVPVDGLQRPGGLQDAAAARAKHVPRHVEEPQPRGMDERPDRRFLVETVALRESQGIDAVERPVGRRGDGGFQGVGRSRIRSLTQQIP